MDLVVLFIKAIPQLPRMELGGGGWGGVQSSACPSSTCTLFIDRVPFMEAVVKSSMNGPAGRKEWASSGTLE